MLWSVPHGPTSAVTSKSTQNGRWYILLLFFFTGFVCRNRRNRWSNGVRAGDVMDKQASNNVNGLFAFVHTTMTNYREMGEDESHRQPCVLTKRHRAPHSAWISHALVANISDVSNELLRCVVANILRIQHGVGKSPCPLKRDVGLRYNFIRLVFSDGWKCSKKCTKKHGRFLDAAFERLSIHAAKNARRKRSK